jgi:hypothetical protein
LGAHKQIEPLEGVALQLQVEIELAWHQPLTGPQAQGQDATGGEVGTTETLQH